MLRHNDAQGRVSVGEVGEMSGLEVAGSIGGHGMLEGESKGIDDCRTRPEIGPVGGNVWRVPCKMTRQLKGRAREV